MSYSGIIVCLCRCYSSFIDCHQSTTSREVVAVKCVKKSSLNRVAMENLLTEIELLKTLKHEHIVELKDFQVLIRAMYLLNQVIQWPGHP